MKHSRLFTILFVLLFCCKTQETTSQGDKKLIEFGWDYPDVNQLKNNLPQMENLPFDGIVFSIQRNIINVLDTTPLSDAYFDYETLQKLKWGKFTDNFIYLWGTSPTGGHWLNDHEWSIILNNTRKISKAVKDSRAQGVLFDPEYYHPDPNKNPWIYSPELYKGMSYNQVAAIVKKRGSQFIAALESHKPDIKILSIWLYGLIVEQLKHKPLEDIGQALLLPFIDGMLANKGPYSTIIDGNESSYWYNNADEFLSSGSYLRKHSKRLLPMNKNADSIEVAQSVYYDGTFDLIPAIKRNTSKAENEKRFEDRIYNALLAADKYVWLYSEKLNWYKPMEDSTVIKIVQRARDKYAQRGKK